MITAINALMIIIDVMGEDNAMMVVMNGTVEAQRQCGTQQSQHQLVTVYPGSSAAEMADVFARVVFATITTTVETRVTNAAQFVELI